MPRRLLREYFGVGDVIPNRRYDNHREHMYRYAVRRRDDLLETVIPFFQQHPMRSPSSSNFDKFAHCVGLISTGRHMSAEGLIEIAEIAQTMNRRKPRNELISILRGHTPDIRDNG